jgi:thiopurine S-methyltransferase
MKREFWEERWRAHHIGFHQSAVNAGLQRHMPALGLEPGDTVLVPLCGKSLDMIWLRDEGYRVIGVELVEQALEEFIVENELAVERRNEANFTRYRDESIELLCGDFFALETADVADVRGVYDRAALIALPPEMRRRYADHLRSILPDEWRMLLLTIQYDQQLKSGPPFAVTGDEVRKLYERGAHVELLQRSDVIAREPRFKEQNIPELWEEAWLIESR